MYDTKRRAGGPVTATILLVIAGAIVAGIIYAWNLVGSSEIPQYKMEISAVYLVSQVSVENARWQVVVIVSNLGNRESVVDKIFVNKKLVEEIEIMQGGSISSKASIGTSIPEGGLKISPGEKATIYVWIGGECYTSGTIINIDVQRIDQLELRRTLELS